MAGMHYLHQFHQMKASLLLWTILATLVVMDFHFLKWEVSSSENSSVHYEVDHLSQVNYGKAVHYLERNPSYYFSPP